MPWSKSKRFSLRAELLLLLVPAMVAVSSVELITTYRYAAEVANAAYDRSLLGVMKAIEANISTASGGLSVELPYRLFELFELTASGSVHFRVATTDGLVELGSADLPQSSQPLSLGGVAFYDASYYGELVRVGTYLTRVDNPPTAGSAREVLIQVSESTQSRADFTRRFLRRTAMRDAVFLLTMLAAVVGIVAFALRPIARIAAHVRARPATDLTPLEPFDLPTDIQPLVHAVNQQIERSRAIAAQQRQFLDDASHQLRTPLTVLRMQVDYALRETDPLQMRDVLNELSKELDKATRSCNQLLSLARSEMAQVKRERFDLSELAREAVLSVMPRARAKGQDLGCEETPAPAMACGDRGLLREAISNLVENAVQYTPRGGEITVHAVSELDVAMVSLCDNGPGVTDEELGTLGKRFARGKNARASQGSGLGLAIARAIIERHGGSLRLQHGPGKRGLRAILSWPIS